MKNYQHYLALFLHFAFLYTTPQLSQPLHTILLFGLGLPSPFRSSVTLPLLRKTMLSLCSSWPRYSLPLLHPAPLFIAFAVLRCATPLPCVPEQHLTITVPAYASLCRGIALPSLALPLLCCLCDSLPLPSTTARHYSVA
jgi:hypothetical protein